MKPLKSQFSDFVQFTDNIHDRIINFHIDNAFYYQIKPLLGVLADAINNATDETLELMPDLEAFYNDHLLRWWVLLAYKRFITNHGRNVTQFGYTKPKDPEGTYDQVTGEERAVVLKELQDDINVVQGNLFVELEKKNWIFDGVTYNATGNKRKKRIGITAIGANTKKCGGCSTPWYLPAPSTPLPEVTEGDYDPIDYIPEDYDLE